ncbi:hypothetical protein HAP47_0019705 [Bradyrhizobium sp. 41S5]|uniref:hypothetical protein n=1 Tax=Bradyrhizobium sp. 41S5 TaxID=1404443 RepID=UPI001E5B15BA|nr:hypothetical protein [Bradyrhizobium sp. 41S5]UFX48762.1 hypothetical protein HAP47_0019705 [Bradyrhizobium sp. 41S5]
MMPLHRDIHWLGRQWAVTGHGLQLINQKQMGYYDIEAARLWEARVTEVQSKVWIDRPDFDRALGIARGKFAYLAPADLPAPPAVAPPPVRATPPALPRAPLDAESVPSIEELLARLKSKSAAAALVAKPAEAAPAPPPGPESPKVESSKAEAPKPEAAQVEPAKAEPAKTEPLKSEALTSDMRQAPPAKKHEAPTLAPVVAVVRRPALPAWPVFDSKIAGSGRFVHPWRVTAARWHGRGLPPRP